ncbi:MAG: PilT/PilU family type 4a pilus ATPase [Candidatus Omnitrophica bacterium]|nr:PilT/PilU family type 4a pilus ATPase [Candidatus Omnitrophota bacterium]
MSFKDIIEAMIAKEASDIFIKAESRLRARINTEVETINDSEFKDRDVEKIIAEIADDYQKELLEKNKSCEFAYSYGERWRFRIGIFRQSNHFSIVIRKIDLNVLPFEELNLPAKILQNFCRERRGIVLLTGITGSGKSTSIASMIEFINLHLGRHILTIEEPIEFVFKEKKSIINQRELGRDVASYPDALKQFAIHSPDVIYIGNIKDRQTCHAAITAAETGVLLFSTVHTVNASSTVERLVNFFPPQQHHFVFNQLSFLLKGVVSLRLIPRSDKEGLIPAYEVMALSPTVSGLIRDNKLWEIPKYMATGDIYGMKTFNQCLLELVLAKKVAPQVALEHADRKEELELQLRHKDFL